MAKNAGALAAKQFKAGTLSEENRQKLLDTTKANIEKAGGDREAGIAATRAALVGAEVPTPTETPTQQEITPPQELETVQMETATTEAEATKAESGRGTQEPTPTTEEPVVEEVAEEEKTQVTPPAQDIQDQPTITSETTTTEVKDEVISPQEKFAQESGVAYIKDDTGNILYQPSSADEYIDLFVANPNIKLDPNSKEGIRSSAAIKSLSGYRGADTQTYLQGFKTGDLGVGGPTWERLVKLNGGEPTPEMMAAREQWEISTKTNNINDTGKAIAGTSGTSEAKTNTTTLQDYDNSYLEQVSALLGNVENEYKRFKDGNPELEALNADLAQTADRIDELQLAKRKTLKDVKKQHPNLPLSAQITLANERLSNLDDQIFVEQRQYNIDLSEYKFKSEEARGEFEFNTKMAQTKMGILGDMYNIGRGDIIRGQEAEAANIIRQEDIERQDTLLADSIARAEEGRKQAIIDGDIQQAKDYAYDLAFLEEQQKYNKDAQNAFKFTTPSQGVVAVMNPSTGEVDFVTAPGAATGGTTQTNADGTPIVWDNTTGATGTISTGNDNITQNYGATSPVTRDNVTLANGQVGTPGVDIDGEIGDSIKSFTNGTVVALQEEKESGGFGRRIVIKDDKGRLHMYNHLNASAVNVGDEVNRGETIAQMGNTGMTIPGLGGNGSHLDYRVSDNGDFSLRGGNWIDPNQFISPEVPADVDQAYTFVLSQLPTKLKDSDKDKEEIRKFVEKQVAAGVGQFEIADTYQGFIINPNNQFGVNIRNLVGTTDSRENMGELGRLINKGQNAQALRIMYLNAGEKAKKLNGEDYVSESFTRVADGQVNKVLDTLTERGLQDGIGVAEGTMEKFIGSKFRGEDTQDILTNILDLTATLSTKLSGTAKTEAELKFISDLLPDIGDSPANFFIKLNNLKDFPLAQYNAQMTQFGLPELNSSTLTNFTNRTDLFNSEGIFEGAETSATTETGSDFFNSTTSYSNSASGNTDVNEFIN